MYFGSKFKLFAGIALACAAVLSLGPAGLPLVKALTQGAFIGGGIWALWELVSVAPRSYRYMYNHWPQHHWGFGGYGGYDHYYDHRYYGNRSNYPGHRSQPVHTGSSFQSVQPFNGYYPSQSPVTGPRGGTLSSSRFVSAAPTPQTGPMGGTLTNSRFVSI